MTYTYTLHLYTPVLKPSATELGPLWLWCSVNLRDWLINTKYITGTLIYHQLSPPEIYQKILLNCKQLLGN